jgi:hypothetical protein
MLALRNLKGQGGYVLAATIINSALTKKQSSIGRRRESRLSRDRILVFWTIAMIDRPREDMMRRSRKSTNSIYGKYIKTKIGKGRSSSGRKGRLTMFTKSRDK